MATKLRAAILIISETASKDSSTDRCGPILSNVFTDVPGGLWAKPTIKIVPDDVLRIQSAITEWTDTDADRAVNVVVTSGGTGFATRDVTPEAISPLLHKHASGLVHAMLSASLSVTPFAAMARPVAGVRNGTVILTLPGSPKGAKENLEAVLKLLPHACQQAAGANSRDLHAGGVEKLEKDAGISAGPAGHGHKQPHTHDHSHSHNHSHGHGHDHSVPKAHTAPSDRPQANDPADGPSQRHRKSPYPMLSVAEALALIEEHTPEPATTTVPVNTSIVGSILAADVQAPESVPAFRASIVDGYAVVAGPKAPSTKGTFPVSQISHAQMAQDVAMLESGQIARITTGAPLPPGATAVVMVEDTIVTRRTDDGREEREVEILTADIESGENVREVGSDVRAGTTILSKGDSITAVGGELGLLASVGVREALVYARPVVGVLSTGDEIIPHDRPGGLQLGEVRDTNRPTLLTAVRGCGFEAVDFGIASDKPGSLESTLRASLKKVDLLITTGGVSMGELDLLKPTLSRALGGEIHFGRVAMKPGKPTTFATLPEANLKDPSTGERGGGNSRPKVVFSLPGNPASAIVTFHLFVLPSLQKMAGHQQGRSRGLPKITVVLDEDVKCDALRSEYHRVIVSARSDGRLYASSTGGQRSSRIGSFRAANGLLCLPAEDRVVRKGETMEALLMGQIIGEGGSSG